QAVRDVGRGDRLPDLEARLVPPRGLRGENRLHGAFGFRRIAIVVRDDRAGELAVDITVAGDLRGLEARLRPFAAHVVGKKKIEVIPAGHNSGRPDRAAQDIETALDLARTDQASSVIRG